MITKQLIEDALEDVRPGLEADGFELTLEAISEDGVVEVALIATPEACHDCLVPDEILTQIIEGSVARRATDVTSVRLHKRGFDG